MSRLSIFFFWVLVAVLATREASANVTVPCSSAALVAAIDAANAQGGDTLTLTAGCVYRLSEVRSTYFGPVGLPLITSAVTIEGNGARISADSSGPPMRLFTVAGAGPLGAAGAPAGTLVLKDVTLSGGRAFGGFGTDGGGGGAGLGGCLFNLGSLSLTGVTVTDCEARGGAGAFFGAAFGGGGGLGGAGGPGAPFLGGGGGGMGGAGGAATAAIGAGGGGGLLGNGGAGAMGAGGGGGSVGSASASTGGPGGTVAGLACEAGGSGGTSAQPSGESGGVCGGGGGAAGSPTNLNLGGSGGSGGFGGGGGGATGGASDPSGTGARGGGSGGVGGGGGGAAAATTGSSSAAGGAGGWGGGGGAGPVGGPGGFGAGGGGSLGAQSSGGFGAEPGSTVKGGDGAGLGGGLFVYGGTVTVLNSTFSSNRARAPSETSGARGMGGAIFVHGGSLVLTSATLAANVATTSGALHVAGGSTSVGNSLLTDSVGDRPGQTPDDCGLETGTTLQTAGTNLVERPNSCPFDAAGPSHDVLGVDPGLGVLQDNGGPTFTHAITPTSPAVDQGRCSQATDQRGANRRRQPLLCDIGAYEIDRFSLKLVFAGTGQGRVTAAGGIDCASGTTYALVQQTSWDLVATPQPGSVFVEWAGDCSGTGPCLASMTRDLEVTATFDLAPQPDASLPDAALAGLDAGSFDAGVAADAGLDAHVPADAALEPEDAAASRPDAEPLVATDAQAPDAQAADARVAADATEAGPDAGSPSISPGCGCRVSDAPAVMPSAFLALGLAGFLARRRGLPGR
ncbi:MAG: choice-of-anchor Q domain-containing protein [Myxococcales bacterium]